MQTYISDIDPAITLTKLYSTNLLWQMWVLEMSAYSLTTLLVRVNPAEEMRMKYTPSVVFFGKT